MSTDEPSTALARQSVEIVSPVQFNEYVAEQQTAHAHVLSPVTNIGSLPAMWKIVPSLVYINPDPRAGEVYQDRLFCGGDEVALTKVGLRKIAQGAALSTKVMRLDSSTVPNYWNMKAVIHWRGFDAQVKEYEASVEWDLREGSEQVNRMVKAAERNRKSGDKTEARQLAAKQVDASRLNGYRNAEARAINAAIREFGLRQKYAQADLRKPFVCFNMVVNPDLGDVEQRRMVLQSALGAMGTLYPPDAPQLSQGRDPFAVDHAHPDAIDAETMSPASEAKAISTSQEVPFEEAGTDAAQSVLVFQVTQSKDSDDYFVVTDVGRLHTSDRGVAAAMNTARKSGQRIRVELGERKGDTTTILEVLGLVEPKL